MSKNFQYPLLFLLLTLLFFRCSSVRSELDWLTPGSYAIYELSSPWVVRFNETNLMVGISEDTVARYGFSVIEVDDEYALLRVSFNESLRLPAIFNTSSLSCLVWVDLETRDLVDRDTGEIWGKCPFWVYPWEAETSIVAFDFLNMTITWDFVSLMSEYSARQGKYSPTLSYLTPIGYFNEFDFIIASFGNKPDQTVVTIETTGNGKYSFPLSFGCYFHAEKGLLLFANTRYADDILAKKFGIIVCAGSLGMAKSEYSQEKLGWIVGCVIIYDTNILKGSVTPTVGGGFPLYIPLLIVLIVLVPLVYYVYVRRLSKCHSSQFSHGSLRIKIKSGYF